MWMSTKEKNLIILWRIVKFSKPWIWMIFSFVMIGMTSGAETLNLATRWPTTPISRLDRMDNHTCLRLAVDTTDTSHLGHLACLHQIFRNLSMIDQISHLLSKWHQHQYKMKILIYKIDIIIFKTKAQQVIWILLQIYFHQRQVPKTSNLKPWLLEEPVAT